MSIALVRVRISPLVLIFGVSYCMKKAWRLWAKALGEKSGSDKEADVVAFIRTIIVIQAIICNLFIVWNIIRGL